MRLQIDLLPAAANTLEIRSQGLTARSVVSEELESLALEPLPKQLPAMIEFGTRLYRLLDGPERRLAALAPNCTLDLHFATEPGRPAAFAHLPWELLHDESGFLIRRGILPVRSVSFGSQALPAPDGAPANRPLNVLFMACSPRNISPVLAFEAEEQKILDATSRQPLYLTPEETGSVEELRETVRAYDPFDVFHLTSHGDLYDEARHKHFLEDGQSFPPGRPIVLTEDRRGDCRLADAEMVERAFENRIPGLVFLSACHTGEQSRAHASLAQDLLYRGFPNVLGWARPVLDLSAIAAAALLYQELAAGSTIEDSVRHALREMARPGPDGQPFQIPDWHLLRLFTTNGAATAALVTPRNKPGRKPFTAPRLDAGFLDLESKKLKVAGFQRFVGRRRSLQRTLPALEPGFRGTGVVIWGMGGLGKSSLAARLCDRVERRNQQFRRAVLGGLLNEDRLLPLLKAKYADHDAALVLDSQLPLGGRLQRFFSAIDAEHPLLLVLDDFEQNIKLDARAPDGFLLSRPAFDILAALGTAIRESQSQSRLIVTTRYWSAGSFPGIDLAAEQLLQMDAAELAKKARKERPGMAPEASQKLIVSAAGNPGLFETLLKEGDPAKAEDIFRNWLRLGSLLATLTDEERTRLARLSMFQIPVLPPLAQAVAGDAEFHRAVGLGLVERTEPPTGESDPRLSVATLVRSLLESALNDEQWRVAYADAARAGYRFWWRAEGDMNVPEAVEMIRLATLGGQREIACEAANPLVRFWNSCTRYHDTVRLARFVLSRFDDYGLFSSLAVAESNLGETAAAAGHLECAYALIPVEDANARAAVLHEIAVLRARQGDFARAMSFYRQSLAIRDQTGSVQGKAPTLHAMAILKAHQGDAAGAMELHRESLEIDRPIGNAKGVAAALRGMASLRVNEGALEEAAGLYRQSLEIEEKIVNDKGRANSLHGLAGVRAQQGDAAGAIDFYGKSLEISERIGDEGAKAATLASLAWLAHQANDSVVATDYSKQASQAMASVMAWPNLAVVLGSLSVFEPGRRQYWATQSVWLILVLRHFSPQSLELIVALFEALPPADRLELPLAAISTFFTGAHPEDEKLRKKSSQLIGAAAKSHSLSEDAVLNWLQEKLQDPSVLVNETLQALEALEPEPWIFDRQTVIASITADMRSSEQATP